MKRIASIIVLITILVFTCGCQNDDKFTSSFPLDKNEVTRILGQVGLQGEVSDDETESSKDGRVSYVIRDNAETCSDSENGKFVANVVSLAHKDGRALATVFDQSVAGEKINWSDWEQQIKFATLLYGGFGNEEVLYNACLEEDLPAGSEAFSFDIELADGYCIVSYQPRTNKTYDDNAFEVVNYSATLRVNIYETKELYEKIK